MESLIHFHFLRILQLFGENYLQIGRPLTSVRHVRKCSEYCNKTTY